MHRALTDLELGMKKDILEEKDHKKVWKHVEKLKNGGKRETHKEVTIYDEDGDILEKEHHQEKFETYWRRIYQKHENDIDIEWDTNERQRYGEELRRGESECRRQNDILREHLDMCSGGFTAKLKGMKEIEISEKDVDRQIQKMKSGKAAGPDGLKVELYKEAIKSKETLKIITDCYSKTIKEGQEEEKCKWRQ